jgi:type IV pilus assembly protein PilX
MIQPPGYREAGVTLVISLLFLLLLTILGVTSMNTSTLQEKMAGNLRDQDTALQAAESALRSGEDELNTLWVSGKPNAGPTCPSPGVCSLGTVDYLNDTWWDNNSREYGGGGDQIAQIGGTAVEPRYALEEHQRIEPITLCTYGKCPPTIQYYKVYSRASGTTTLSQVVIEETFRTRY